MRVILPPNTLTPNATATGGVIFPQLIGNKELISEEVLAYELGYRAQITDTLSVDIATFYNDYKDLTVIDFGTVPLEAASLKPVSQMEGETYGVELAVNWQPAPWWRLYGAYTYLQMELHSRSPVQSPLITLRKPRLKPRARNIRPM